LLFDTVDHAIPLQRLQSEFGVNDTPLGLALLLPRSTTQFAKLGQQQLQVVGLDENRLQHNPDGQVGGTHHYNHRSVTRSYFCCVVGSCCRCLGVVLDRRLTYEMRVTIVARSCYYLAQAIRHIRHLLASTLARSLILMRLDYCNSLLHGSHTSSIQTLQRVQNNTF